ncbi:MAG: alpha/beta fold hydrolase [Candidatus Omnitrophota bacterium]|nr:alpha/beta fold hydrolase [Candidatus Omnitrophota bacterium]
MQLNYQINGQGNRTLFFIHGWASDKSVWKNQVEEFKKDYKVISVDLAGQGESPWIETDNLLGHYSESILGLCNDLKLKQVDFIGWSLSGYILFELHKKSPELFNSLTFVASTPKFLNSPDYNCGMDEPNLKLLEKKLKENLSSALDEFRLFMFSRKEREDFNFPRIWELLKNISSSHPQALNLGLELLQNADFRPYLSGIDKPTLLIAGEKDTVTPKSAAEFMHEKIKGSELTIFKDCGHAPFLTQPEKFNQILREWISKR